MCVVLLLLFYALCVDVLVFSFVCIGWVACTVGVLCPVVGCLCVLCC